MITNTGSTLASVKPHRHNSNCNTASFSSVKQSFNCMYIVRGFCYMSNHSNRTSGSHLPTAISIEQRLQGWWLSSVLVENYDTSYSVHQNPNNIFFFLSPRNLYILSWLYISTIWQISVKLGQRTSDLFLVQIQESLKDFLTLQYLPFFNMISLWSSVLIWMTNLAHVSYDCHVYSDANFQIFSIIRLTNLEDCVTFVKLYNVLGVL